MSDNGRPDRQVVTSLWVLGRDLGVVVIIMVLASLLMTGLLFGLTEAYQWAARIVSQHLEVRR